MAPSLLGSYLVMDTKEGIQRHVISDVEVYRGEEDQASHARRGKTPRTRIMYSQGGRLYVYLIYGMHWMLNIVTGPVEMPQALLIRGLKTIQGPGRLTRQLGINGSFHEEDLTRSHRIWIEANASANGGYVTRPRVGIDYAGEKWRNKPWRFILDDQ